MSPETIILPNGEEVVLIHYLVVEEGKDHRIACMPGLKDFSAGSSGTSTRGCGHQRSEVPAVATCPMCKRTPEYRKAMGLPLEDPAPVRFSPRPKPAPVVVPPAPTPEVK